VAFCGSFSPLTLYSLHPGIVPILSRWLGNPFHLLLFPAMPAPRSLDSLPFDVFYQIATSLDDRDCINLSRTNRTLHDFMDSDLIARKTVEVSSQVRELRAPRASVTQNPRAPEPLFPSPLGPKSHPTTHSLQLPNH
jgi:hypothetical protein